MNLSHPSDLKAIANLLYTENTVLPEGFMITALGSPSGTVCNNLKLKLSQIPPEPYQIFNILNPSLGHLFDLIVILNLSYSRKAILSIL